MRKQMWIGAGVLAILAMAWAQPKFNLRGNRFKPLVYEQMTPKQKAMMDHLLAGPRTSLDGPFNVFLRSPEMGDLAQQLGAQIRFHSSVPTKLNEIAILMTARYWTAQFEWAAHHRAGLQAGLTPEFIDAIANGRRPTGMQPPEEAVYNFCYETLTNKEVSDATFQAVVRHMGEQGTVDLINAMGYYSLVSMALNADRYPMAEGTVPELKPLPR